MLVVVMVMPVVKTRRLLLRVLTQSV